MTWMAALARCIRSTTTNSTGRLARVSTNPSSLRTASMIIAALVVQIPVELLRQACLVHDGQAKQPFDSYGHFVEIARDVPP